VSWFISNPISAVKSDTPQRGSVSKKWQAACRMVGVPEGLRIHDLRHHAATLAARMPGITTKELMARIGHSSSRAALIYQHASEERDQTIAEFIDTAIATSRPRSRGTVTTLKESRRAE
jgi:integrase